MKRDMELIRLLLLQQETDEKPPDLDKYDERLVVYNLALMKDAGLIDAAIVEDHTGFPSGASVIRLTWAGHDFLDATRNQTIWNKAKEVMLKPGISWTFSLLLEFLKAEAKKHFLSGPTDVSAPISV